MNNAAIHSLVPQNTMGKPSAIEESMHYISKEAAQDGFKRASKRLLNMQVWHKLVGDLSASFLLTDQNGEEAHRLAAVDDYVRIDIPGPGSAAGEGYDWVKIERVEAEIDEDGEEENILLQLRPCSDPKKNAGTAHFFTNKASSTFIVERENNTVTVFYYGRNEILNTAADNITDKLRNAVVASGAIAGLSELQWTALIKSFLSAEI